MLFAIYRKIATQLFVWLYFIAGFWLWIIDFIINPEHERFYGKKNDRMPCFGRDNKLSFEEIEIVVDWIRSRPAGK
jgi:hypothetical protein